MVSSLSCAPGSSSPSAIPLRSALATRSEVLSGAMAERERRIRSGSASADRVTRCTVAHFCEEIVPLLDCWIVEQSAKVV
jgi:hypothetical protein